MWSFNAGATRASGVEVYIQGEVHTIRRDEASSDIVTITTVIEHLNERPGQLLNFAGRIGISEDGLKAYSFTGQRVYPKAWTISGR